MTSVGSVFQYDYIQEKNVDCSFWYFLYIFCEQSFSDYRQDQFGSDSVLFCYFFANWQFCSHFQFWNIEWGHNVSFWFQERWGLEFWVFQHTTSFWYLVWVWLLFSELSPGLLYLSFGGETKLVPRIRDEAWCMYYRGWRMFWCSKCWTSFLSCPRIELALRAAFVTWSLNLRLLIIVIHKSFSDTLLARVCRIFGLLVPIEYDLYC